MLTIKKSKTENTKAGSSEFENPIEIHDTI